MNASRSPKGLDYGRYVATPESMLEQPLQPDVPKPPDVIKRPQPVNTPIPPGDPIAEDRPDVHPVPHPTDPGPAVI